MTFVSMGRWRSKWPAQHCRFKQFQTPFSPSLLSIHRIAHMLLLSFSPSSLFQSVSAQPTELGRRRVFRWPFAAPPAHWREGRKMPDEKRNLSPPPLIPFSLSELRRARGNERRRRREYRTPPLPSLCAYIAYDFETRQTSMLDQKPHRVNG